MLNGPDDSRVVVIRTWTERGEFRARMILQSDGGDLRGGPEPDDARLSAGCAPTEGVGMAQVVVTDSIDWLCDSLRAFLVQHEP